jgi:hypothetical protein
LSSFLKRLTDRIRVKKSDSPNDEAAADDWLTLSQVFRNNIMLVRLLSRRLRHSVFCGFVFKMNLSVPVLLFLGLGFSSVTCDSTRQAKEFLTTGLTRIFWQNLRPEISDHVSQRCFDSLADVLRGLQNGAAWSFACK